MRFKVAFTANGNRLPWVTFCISRKWFYDVINYDDVIVMSSVILGSISLIGNHIQGSLDLPFAQNYIKLISSWYLRVVALVVGLTPITCRSIRYRQQYTKRVWYLVPYQSISMRFPLKTNLNPYIRLQLFENCHCKRRMMDIADYPE